ELADWDSLNAEVRVFTEHIADPDELVRRLAGFDVVVAMRERTPFPESVLSRLPDLRLLVTTGQRNASIDVEAARRHGILVCGTGYLPHPTVELTWALILAACRNLPTEFQAMRDGGWQTTIGTGLRGKTLGVLGLGRLGSQVARVGQAFGMRTIAWSQNLTAERAAEHDVTAVSKDELLAASDVLTVHLVLSARTRGLIGAAELGALREGSIGGAALDVYDEEPLPADHPLRTLPNVVLTPHIGFVTRDVYEVFYRDAVADIAAYQAGAPVRVIEP